VHELLARILAFAEARPPVRAAVLIGSRATAAPADEPSDLDPELYYAGRSPRFADRPEGVGACSPR
jgi:hypothetical protein